MSAGGIVACISIIWIRTAMSLDEALQTCEAPLREISERLSADLEG